MQRDLGNSLQAEAYERGTRRLVQEKLELSRKLQGEGLACCGQGSVAQSVPSVAHCSYCALLRVHADRAVSSWLHSDPEQLQPRQRDKKTQ